MFQWISLILFLVVLGIIALHVLFTACASGFSFSVKEIIRKKIHVGTLFLLEQDLNWIGRIKKLLFLVLLSSFAVLFVTGFGPVLLGYRLHGYLLMIHASFAPVFIGTASLLILLGAQKVLTKNTKNKSSSCRCGLIGTCICSAACFWALAFLALPVTLSMVLSMFPVFGTDWQILLLEVHRYSTLLLACVTFIYLYILIRRGIMNDKPEDS